MIYSDGKKYNLIALLIAFSGISVLCSIAGCLCGVSIKNGLIFACYQVFNIIFPGTAIALRFIRKREIWVIAIYFASC